MNLVHFPHEPWNFSTVLDNNLDRRKTYILLFICQQYPLRGAVHAHGLMLCMHGITIIGLVSLRRFSYIKHYEIRPVCRVLEVVKVVAYVIPFTRSYTPGLHQVVLFLFYNLRAFRACISLVKIVGRGKYSQEKPTIWKWIIWKPCLSVLSNHLPKYGSIKREIYLRFGPIICNFLFSLKYASGLV